jgi:hypothetical protein
LRLISILLTLFAYAPAGLSADPLLAFGNQIAIFPAGWDSEQQIEIAKSRIDFDPAVIRRAEDRIQIVAAIRGNFSDNGSEYVLEGEKAQVTYPRTDDSIGHVDGPISKGEVLVSYAATTEISFLFLLRNIHSEIPSVQFQDNQLYFYVDKPLKLYSMASGKVSLNLIPTQEMRAGMVTIANTTASPNVVFIYPGVEDVTVENHTQIAQGRLIGKALNSINSFYIAIAIQVRGTGIMNPLVVYVATRE